MSLHAMTLYQVAAKRSELSASARALYVYTSLTLRRIRSALRGRVRP